jgi:hypothetical protein
VRHDADHVERRAPTTRARLRALRGLDRDQRQRADGACPAFGASRKILA